MEQEQINLEEIIKDPTLMNTLSDKLTQYKTLYYSPGEYKRTPLYNLIESQNYNANYFLDEFLKITAKQCKLPKGQRDIIVAIVGDAMHYVWLRNKRNGNKKESGGKDPNTK